jgi:hypothetical protein
MLLTFQGDFDAAKFDASRPQFEQFVNSFRFETPASATAAAAPAATGTAPEGAGDAIKPANASAPTGAGTPKVADASTPTGPAAPKTPDASVPAGPAAPKPADASAPTGAAASRPVDPSAPTTRPAAASRPAAQPTGVAGPAGAVAAPLKAGRVDVEFGEGVTGSIEFPAGFQHTGKSPDASTAPANGVAAAGSEAPETIKIEVKKLGQGVVYNELRRQTLSTDAPNGLAKTLDHGTCNVAGRSDAEFFVVAADQGTNPPAGGGDAAKRRRMIFLANIQAKKLAVKITADVAEANYKTRKEEIKACVKSLKFE